MACLVAQGFLANDAAAAGEFAPMDPAAVHPIIHRGAAYASEGHGEMNGKKVRFFLAVLAKEAGRCERRHSHSELPMRAICIRGVTE